MELPACALFFVLIVGRLDCGILLLGSDRLGSRGNKGKRDCEVDSWEFQYQEW